MRQGIVRGLAVGALLALAPASPAVGGTLAAGRGADRNAPSSSASRAPATPWTRAAWDDAVKSAPRADTGSVRSGGTTSVTAAAAPALAVTPDTNLVRGQVVSVTGSDLGSGQIVLVQCPVDVAPAYFCDYRSAAVVTPDASGSIAASFTVHRVIESPVGRVDCASAPGTCDLVAASLGAAILARHALAFDPTAPPPDSRITVTPSTGLLGNQSVTVAGSGFLPADQVWVRECAVVDAECQGSFLQVITDAAGAFSTPLTVRLRVNDATGTTTHCLAVDCIVRASSHTDLEFEASAPITFDPGQPPPSLPSITVTPSTGLLHDQTVTITGTGFDPAEYVDITECIATDPYCYEYLVGAEPDAAGSFTATAPVTRLVAGYSPGGLDVVDCALTPCRITATGYTNEDTLALRASAPVSFDGSVAPPVPPAVTVTPSTNLPYRADVTVRGTGYRPGSPIYADYCGGSMETGGCASYAEGTADASGTVELTLTVKRRIFTGGVDPIDCVEVGTTCSVNVSGARGYERAQIDVSFDPNAPIPPSPVATVTPDHDLGYRQTLAVTGSGFAPGSVPVQQCGRVDLGFDSFEICAGFTELQAGADGAVSGTVEVRRFPSFFPGESLDCATSATPCTLRIGSGDPDESAIVPLAFDPSSQPPPPPVVTVSPRTHLHDGQEVTARGSRFGAGALLGLAQCRAGVTQIADGCDISHASVAVTDAAGAFTATRTVAGVIGTSQGPVDCTVAGACVLAVANAGELSELAVAPLQIDAPTLAVHDATVMEGTGEDMHTEVMVELSAPTTTPLTVEWQAAAATAGDQDFAPRRGRVTIPAGAAEAMIPLHVVGDRLDETTEHFTVEVTRALGTRVTDRRATVTITDDDRAPSVSVRDGRRREDHGEAHAEVLLSAPSGQTVIVHYVTHHGTARAGSDYVRKDSRLVFLPGETRHLVRILLVDDHAHEPTEWFRVELDRAEHAHPADAVGIVTVTDDD